MAKASTAVSAAPAARFELLPLDRLVESPTNHRRKTWGDLDELAESIKAKGVLQPVLVRPVAGDSHQFEIVFGHRRFRAAQKAGLTEIPATVRELTDVEVLEAQVIENLQRQDVHPLEEAEGYEQLLGQKERPYTIEEIAAKVGRSPSYVYGRMRLLDLCKEGRKAFYDGNLTSTSALYIARIPDLEVQREVLKDLGQYHRDDSAWPASQVSSIVQRHLLRLTEAPFSRDAEDLVPGAGPCKTCPKRSGAQPQLFADVDKRDGELCTDPSCYRKKVEAAWARRRAAEEEKGHKVLEGKAGEKACSYGGEYVRLDQHNHNDPKYRTWKQLLGKAAKDQVVVARDERGQVHELLPKKEAKKLLKAAGHDFRGEGPGRARSASSKSSKADLEKERLACELAEMVDRRVAEVIVARFEKGMVPPWKTAARMVLDFAEFTLERRLGADWQRQRGKADEKLVADLSEDQARGFVLEALFERAIFDTGWTPPSEKGVREELLAWAGIDRKALVQQAKAELAAVAAPVKLSWQHVKGTGGAVAEVPGGTYELTSDNSRWNVCWQPEGGTGELIASCLHRPDAERKAEQHLAEHASDGALTKKELSDWDIATGKGPATARKREGRRA